MNVKILTCPNCGYQSLPPKYNCPQCRTVDLRCEEVSGKGTIFSYTTIHVAPAQFAEQVPYHLILVDLECGLRVTSRLIEGVPSIGLQVDFSSLKDSIYWFKPIS